MSSQRGYLGVLVADFHFPESGSLKAKRRELASIKAQANARLGVSAAEVAFHDLWQRARLTIVLAGADSAATAAHLARVERWLDARWPEGASYERFLVATDDLAGEATGPVPLPPAFPAARPPAAEPTAGPGTGEG